MFRLAGRAERTRIVPALSFSADQATDPGLVFRARAAILRLTGP